MIEKLRTRNASFAVQTLGYAGRLDPMAEGVLLVLVGEENKKRKQYEQLEKEYTADILFGIATDSYDALGIIDKVRPKDIDQQVLKAVIKQHVGRYKQHYPPYSSHLVRGKPLFYWARSGNISQISLPSKTIEVYNIDVLSITQIKGNEIASQAMATIAKVKGEFRQEEILTGWKEFQKEHGKSDFQLARCRVICSSGTYIRSIVNETGKILSSGALAFRIQRTKVGRYRIKNAIRI